MSELLTFKLTEDQIKEFDCFDEDGDTFLKISRNELVNYCLKNPSTDLTYSHWKKLKYLVTSIVAFIERKEKYSCYLQWKDNLDQELDIYDPSNGYLTLDKESVIDNFIEELLLFVEVIPTADWYDDRDKFYIKRDELFSQLREFEETIEDVVIQEIITHLQSLENKEQEDSSQCKDNVLI